MASSTRGWPSTTGERTNTYRRPPSGAATGAVVAFARGADDNLYEIHKDGSGAWAPTWRQMTTDSRVRGRISIALTHTLAQSFELRGHPSAADRHPPVRIFCNVAEELGAGRAADEDSRTRLLYGLGPLPRGFEAYELALV